MEQVSCFQVLSYWKYLACSQILLIYSIFYSKNTKPRYNVLVLHSFYIFVPNFIHLNIKKYKLLSISEVGS